MILPASTFPIKTSSDRSKQGANLGMSIVDYL